jgi:hypothetical protein
MPNGNYENTVEFLHKVFEMMLIYIQKSNNRNEKVKNYEPKLKQLNLLLDLNFKLKY